MLTCVRPCRQVCRVLCGGSSPEMKARIRDETARATLELLRIAKAGSAPDEAKPDEPEPVGPPQPDAPSTDATGEPL